MHLLIAAHDFYPDPGSGGTGRYVYETGKRFIDRGYHVSVITRRRGDVPRRESVQGIDVYRYDLSIANCSFHEILRQLPSAYQTVSRYVEELRTKAIDLLSFQGPVTSFLVDRVTPEAIPRSCTFHSPWPTEYAIKTRNKSSISEPRRRINIGFRKRLEGYVLSHCDDTVVLSETMGTHLRQVYNINESSREPEHSNGDVTVVHGGVDIDRFAPDRDSYSLMGDPAFLTVRRLSERMGHALLLRAFATIVPDHPGARLYIAGDGPLREELEQQAAALNVDERTTFLGYVPDDELPGVYASADVFVLPTQELEGFGLATLEALASGTPVIGTPVGGTCEILGTLDDHSMPATMLLSHTDAEDLTGAMRSWATTTTAERVAAGNSCRRYVCDQYTWEQTVGALESHYSEVVQ